MSIPIWTGVVDPDLALLLLFAPGYIVVAALFPEGHRINWGERVGLSIGVSFLVVPFLVIVLNRVSPSIHPVLASATLSLITALTGLLAYWRRTNLPLDSRLSAAVRLAWPGGRQYRTLHRILTIALAGSIVLALGTLAYLVLRPPHTELFTEFYILGSDGNASAHPVRLNASEESRFLLGIANHEATRVNYTVRVDLVGVKIFYNATAMAYEIIELNRTTWSWLNVTLGDGQSWTDPYIFSIPTVGDWEVQFLLFKNGSTTAPYRQLRLIIQVVKTG